MRISKIECIPFTCTFKEPFPMGGGVEMFTRQLAKTVIGQGINVNSVASGWSLTNFDKRDKELLKARFLPETPIGGGTEPQDIANAVAFLVSDVASDIVGQVVTVDGGSTMA